GGEDRRAAADGVVDAGMHAHDAEDRVALHAEASADAGARSWVPEQELPGALAILIEIIERAVVHLEAIIGVNHAAEGGAGVEQFGFIGGLAVVVGLR